MYNEYVGGERGEMSKLFSDKDGMRFSDKSPMRFSDKSPMRFSDKDTTRCNNRNRYFKILIYLIEHISEKALLLD